MAGPRYTWRLLVPILLFSVLSLASPTTVDSVKPRSTSDPLNCSSKFSSDYYGLGVRLGIYLTWLTSYLANAFVEEEIASALDANSIFLLSLLISIFKGTGVSGLDKLAYIDGLVLMQFCAGYLFGILSLWGYRTVHYTREGPRAVRHYGKVGTHCRLLLSSAISIYGVWFWSYGIRYDHNYGLNRVTDAEGRPRPPQCYPVYVFFFAKLNVLRGIRILYIFMSVCCSLYFGIMLLAALAERIRHLTQVITKEKGHAKRETFNYQTGLSKKELNFLFNLHRIYNLIWIGFSITQVELTLRWNHVLDVFGPNGNISYPAQLLPLLIGALGFIRICWLIFKQWRDGPEDCCDENEAGGEKVGVGPGAAAALDAGLGIMPSSPAYPNATNAAGGRFDDASMVANRSYLTRYSVAYLPWLSQFEFWKSPKRHRPLPTAVEEEGHNYRDSPLVGVETRYKPSESKEASPMIDMKTPTLPPTSPRSAV